MVCEEMPQPAPLIAPFGFTDTDPTRWRLRVHEGRQIWEYIGQEEQQADHQDEVLLADGRNSGKLFDIQSKAAKYWLGILKPEDLPSAITKNNAEPSKDALEAAIRGYRFFEQLQTADGHWAGEYGGPLFLMPGLVITCYITGVPFSREQRVEMIRYLRNKAHPGGGWGLHIAGESTVFGTALNYVTMRLLGVPVDDSCLVAARKFLMAKGGAVGCPHWGKFWLSVLNVHSWEGCNPIPPEVWLVPHWLPFHPARMWCHCRQVYLPMSYCYATRFQADASDPLILQLRREIYCQPFEEIDWSAVRNTVASVDVYAPHHRLLDVANAVFVRYEQFQWPWLRQRALKEVLDQIRAEDLNTKFISIGPISKIINMLVVWHAEGPQSSSFKAHCDRIPDYLWMNHDGMRMQGTNGSQLWDTALAIHAIMAGRLYEFPEFQPSLWKALKFLDLTQIKQNVPDRERYYRQQSRGAFPFSTRDCGWIVTDCTAEGLKAVVQLQNGVPDMQRPVADHRLFDSVEILLSMQNVDGGYASYERRRGPFWLEMMNPSEVFGEIMVDYSYTECSSAVVQALTTFQKWYPDHRAAEIADRIGRAMHFIRSQQRADGGWYGSWGICFTYAGWFAMEALACVGDIYDKSEIVRRGCDYLVGKQKADGGWGESYESCTELDYVQHRHSQVVNTAWACLALMAGNYPGQDVLERAMRFLIKRQQPTTGEWLQEDIEGKYARLYGNPRLL